MSGDTVFPICLHQQSQVNFLIVSIVTVIGTRAVFLRIAILGGVNVLLTTNDNYFLMVA